MEKITIILPLGEIQAAKLTDIAEYEGLSLPFMLRHLIEHAYGEHEAMLDLLYREADCHSLSPDSGDEVPF